MLPLIAVVFWYLVFSYTIYQLIRTQVVLMTKAEVLIAFGIKVLAACLYGYIFLHYYGGDDTWKLHASSLKEKEMLLDDPYRFFWEFTPITAIRNGDTFIQIVGFYL